MPITIYFNNLHQHKLIIDPLKYQLTAIYTPPLLQYFEDQKADILRFVSKQQLIFLPRFGKKQICEHT